MARLTTVLLFLLAILGGVPISMAKPSRDSQSAAEPFRILKPEELVFFNADHSPLGAYTSLVYGCNGRNSAWGGFALQGGKMPKTGILIGMVDSAGLHRMPFLPGVKNEIDPAHVRRTLAPCTDTWTTAKFSWTHFSPSWQLSDFAGATEDQKKRFLLPATFIEFAIDNSTGTAPFTFVFGIPVSAQKSDFAGGAFGGFVYDKTHALAVAAGTADLLDEQAAHALNPLLPGSIFAVKVAAGETKHLTVFVASYDTQRSTGSLSVLFYYTSLFHSLDDVIAYAAEQSPVIKARCHELDDRLAASGQNVYRQFLAAEALNSYRYNTVLLRDDSGNPVFGEIEGQYDYINTFDLTVDHAFYQLAMHPWTMRNVLDRFVANYSYQDRVRPALKGPDFEGGICFTHDMGWVLDFEAAGQSRYENQRHHVRMSTEELQNWIICAGLYWEKTGDSAWLHGQDKILHECLTSLVNRDAVDPGQRRGIIGLFDRSPAGNEEISTYDALDASLKQVRNNAYIAVKCWACYLILEAEFGELGDPAAAGLAHQQAVRAADTIVSYWNPKDGYIPAIFDGKNQSRIIPIVEPLAYVEQMGFSDDLSFDGPYGKLIHALHDHLDTVLRPGVCLDTATGAWKLSSTSVNTWQSKVYLSQYVAEKILHLTGDRIDGKVDAVHASFQVLGAPDCGWADQLNAGNGAVIGSRHYPRGVTSALWWLTEPTTSH